MDRTNVDLSDVDAVLLSLRPHGVDNMYIPWGGQGYTGISVTPWGGQRVYPMGWT